MNSEMKSDSCCDRRSFLGKSLGCGAYVMTALAAGSSSTRRLFAAEIKGETYQQQARFARVEKVADGVWTIVSTPDGGSQTTSNGGIVAGRDASLVIEGFNTVEGGAWASDVCLELTGRRPQYVVLTHFHGDHSNGLSGYQHGNEPLSIVSTAKTCELLLNDFSGLVPAASTGDAMTETARRLLLPNSVIVDYDTPTEIDLGGKTVRLRCRAGHTPSDITVEVDEPRVVWCGDLCFNGLFPFYGDAIPSVLGKNCNEFLTDANTTYVPGHGAVANAEDLKPYLALLADVEAAARKAHGAGISTDEAWQAYEIPASLGEWGKFRPDVYRFAFEAWAKELG